MALFCKNGGYAPGVCRRIVERLFELLTGRSAAPKSRYVLPNLVRRFEMALFCKNGGYVPSVCRHMVERLSEQLSGRSAR